MGGELRPNGITQSRGFPWLSVGDTTTSRPSAEKIEFEHAKARDQRLGPARGKISHAQFSGVSVPLKLMEPSLRSGSRAFCHRA
jgi:hypothetical protein